jgi:hypothetical protein
VISVIVPTIQGREHHLDGCKVAYAAHTEDYELIVVRDEPTCGIAWQAGADLAVGDYLHFSADDINPRAGWWQAAIETVGQGDLPAGPVFATDGSLQSCGGSWGELEPDGAETAFTRVPFMSREQWAKVGPMIPTHYFTDNWVTFRGAQAGIRTVVNHGYAFTHHHVMEGRNEGRMAADGIRYQEYQRFPPVAA